MFIASLIAGAVILVACILSGNVFLLLGGYAFIVGCMLGGKKIVNKIYNKTGQMMHGALVEINSLMKNPDVFSDGMIFEPNDIQMQVQTQNLMVEQPQVVKEGKTGTVIPLPVNSTEIQEQTSEPDDKDSPSKILHFDRIKHKRIF
jgi:hypothetical protein